MAPPPRATFLWRCRPGTLLPPAAQTPSPSLGAGGQTQSAPTQARPRAVRSLWSCSVDLHSWHPAPRICRPPKGITRQAPSCPQSLGGRSGGQTSLPFARWGCPEDQQPLRSGTSSVLLLAYQTVQRASPSPHSVLSWTSPPALGPPWVREHA